jgi:ArsR family metal-binding transcriptional regulator
MDDVLIKEFLYHLVESGCSPGSGRYGLQVDIPQDISPVFPYLNAQLDNTRYNHQNGILIWREKDRAYALRAHEIKIVYGVGIDDLEKARGLVTEIIERLNSVWKNREDITPCFTEKAPPSVMDIFKLLPRTNCKECGYVTCLVYAADLCEGKAGLEACPVLLDPKYADKRETLMDMLTGANR